LIWNKRTEGKGIKVSSRTGYLLLQNYNNEEKEKRKNTRMPYLESFSQMTGMRCGYLARMRSASSFLFSKGCFCLNDVAVAMLGLVFWKGS